MKTVEGAIYVEAVWAFRAVNLRENWESGENSDRRGNEVLKRSGD